MEIEGNIKAVVSGSSVVTHEFTGSLAGLHRELDHLEGCGSDVSAVVVSRHGADCIGDVAVAEVVREGDEWVSRFV